MLAYILTRNRAESKASLTKNYHNHDSEDAASGAAASAIAESYNEQIRPLLDAVDRLRHLKVTQEGIQLPTIVVVGDQSSGKSSVLESLAGISLPRGQGICTRVPLVMRLKDDLSAEGSQPVLQLEYGSGRVVTTSEAKVADAIDEATAEIAGSGKGISDAPITLVVRKRGVPDLTLVDLPGITRVPVKGQPDDIYDQVSRIIQEYIVPKESIILNVLSATVDFPTCESIRMSQQVDRNGERTLAVVTKSDRAPEGLLDKVTMDDVNIGLGYVCVRNRVGDETYDQARAEEERLFKKHPLLSKIDKSMVGIPVLAQRLMQI
nr:putative dynamin-related protein 4A [Lolium perenne]